MHALVAAHYRLYLQEVVIFAVILAVAICTGSLLPVVLALLFHYGARDALRLLSYGG